MYGDFISEKLRIQSLHEAVQRKLYANKAHVSDRSRTKFSTGKLSSAKFPLKQSTAAEQQQRLI